jgi:hypothetical protein
VSSSPVGESLEHVLTSPDYQTPHFRKIMAAMRRPLWFARPNDQGRFIATGWEQPSYAYVGVDLHSGECFWAGESEDKLTLDPAASAFAAIMVRYGRGSAVTSIRHHDWNRGWGWRPWATTGEIHAASKNRTDVARVCEWERGEQPAVGRFSYRSVMHVSDLEFFHATRKSQLRSVRRVGLLPSKLARGEVDANALHGWTWLNFDLQDAIYLTASESYAEAIAQTLQERWGEPAVIVSVRGSDLDLRHLTVDEDALRSKYHGEVSDEGCVAGLPAYLSSLLWGEHLSVAYLDWIPTSRLRFVWETPDEDPS